MLRLISQKLAERMGGIWKHEDGCVVRMEVYGSVKMGGERDCFKDVKCIEV